MTTVSSATTTTPSASTATATPSAYNNLSQNDFMKLLTTQLAHQDPTSPVDDTQMLAQLAQFSTLGAANQTNTELATISGQISAATSSAPTGTTTSGTTTASGVSA